MNDTDLILYGVYLKLLSSKYLRMGASTQNDNYLNKSTAFAYAYDALIRFFPTIESAVEKEYDKRMLDLNSWRDEWYFDVRDNDPRLFTINQ